MLDVKKLLTKVLQYVYTIGETTSGGINYYKCGRVVTVCCYANLSATNDGATVFTIPSGYRPHANLDCPVFDANGRTMKGTLRFQPSGAVVAVFGNLSACSARFSVTYIS